MDNNITPKEVRAKPGITFSGKKVRTKLRTAFAKEAFDKLNALGPIWVCVEDGPKRVYLSPTIETKDIGGSVLFSPDSGWAETLDAAVVNTLEALQQVAQQDNKLVVVNAYQDNRAEYTYDSASSTFSPYVP